MRPSGLAEQQLQNSLIKNRETAVNTEKSKLVNRAALAKINQDNEAWQGAIKDISDWNKKYPTLKITFKTISKSIKSRKANQRNAVNGIVSRKKLDFIREDEDIGG
jgi:hypothetical protein